MGSGASRASRTSTRTCARCSANPVRGKFHLRYCGKGDLAACRASLWAAVDQVAAQRRGRSRVPIPAAWRSAARRTGFTPGLIPDTFRDHEPPDVPAGARAPEPPRPPLTAGWRRGRASARQWPDGKGNERRGGRPRGRVAGRASTPCVSDVTRMGEWSPETVRCEWIDGATGPAVGATFKGSNKRGIARWSTKPVVVAAEPGREFAFVVDETTKWAFRCEPDGTGTRLVESFEMLEDVPRRYVWAERYIMRIKDRRADLERGMARDDPAHQAGRRGLPERLITGSGRSASEILGVPTCENGYRYRAPAPPPGRCAAPRSPDGPAASRRNGSGAAGETAAPGAHPRTPDARRERHGPRTREFREAGA